MPQMMGLIDRVLCTSGCEDRYNRRKCQYQSLAQHAKLPPNLAAVSNNELPWRCHGLAFRMATYSEGCENLFARWDILLSHPQHASGWQSEYGNWNNDSDHWAKKWDKFYHFVWLLQCYEYFIQRGLDVSFPATSAPDLLIAGAGMDPVHAECFFYSKWWIREAFLEDVLSLVDPNLSIRRTTNIIYADLNNPFSQNGFAKTLEHVASMLAPKKLAEATAMASKTSPQTICSLEDAGIKILLKGDGEYRPDPDSAQGDPTCSRPAFISEIIKAKECSNNLKASRPNIVMANGLGLDFQLSNPIDQSNVGLLESNNIDELWIAACGVDDQLAKCKSVNRLQRSGYPGSGLWASGY